MVTSTTLGLYLNATLFNQSVGYKVPPSTPISDMALNFTSSNEILLDVSPYSVNSLLLTLQDSNTFNITITQETLGPQFGPEYLNTTFGETILPGLIAHFGADQPMSLGFATKEAPLSYSKADEMGLHVTGYLMLWVRDELACIIEVNDAQAGLAASLKDFVLQVQLLSFYINGASVAYSAIGEIDVQAMRTLVNFFARVLIPVVDRYLEPGFPLPREYFGIVRVKDAFFQAMDGYLQVGLVPEFI